jgi:hypothetical protein
MCITFLSNKWRTTMKMRNTLVISLFVCLTGTAPFLHAQERGSLDAKLEVFRPFLGKTWRGVLGDPGANELTIDIARYERALNGTAVRTLHSVNDGSYGGESIIFWDKKKESLVFYYFTTAGFHTTGTMSAEGQSFTAHEIVSGNENGITEVKSTATLGADGKLRTASQYFRDGAWVPGHTAVYEEAADAEVRFR